MTWILARVFVYLPSFCFQILDFSLIYWTSLIFYFDLFWMAWYWKPAIGEKEEEPALIMVSCRNTQHSLLLAYRTPLRPQIPQFSFFELISVYFCLFYFSKLNFTYFFDIYHNYSVFQDVPCSMFLVLKKKVTPKGILFLSSPIQSLYWVKLLTEVAFYPTKYVSKEA